MYFTQQCAQLYSQPSTPATRDTLQGARSNPGVEVGVDKQSLVKWFEMYFPFLPLAQAIARLPNIPLGSWGTCAAVGNGDNVLGMESGADIDAHDFVIRCAFTPPPPSMSELRGWVRVAP
jgi:hypothetical protein